MALVAYTRFRYLWGAVDFTTDQDAPTYNAGNTQANIPPNILGRKLVVEWDRSALALDVAQTHIDIANITSGQLDDSWTDADFANVETAFDTFWNAIKAAWSVSVVLGHYRWYRVGPGATPPEPAVRVVPKNIPGTGTGPNLPAQCATNITLRTGLRKAWGRMYFPHVTTTHITQGGDIPNLDVDNLAGSFNTFVTQLAAADFYPFVYSKVHQRGYNVEKTVVDNVFDTQRRRRHRTHTYQKVLP